MTRLTGAAHHVDAADAPVLDHLSFLCRTLLGRRSTATLLQAASIATDTRLDETITADHALVRWKMPRLLLCLLDSPAHMTR